jgi:farnesyl diphosphate synthase/geranylgeranyl diphosphate synthase type II
MVPLAVRAALDGANRLGSSSAAAGRIVLELMRASGAGGMIGGQLLDLDGERQPLAVADLERIHRAKTGALIQASTTIGGLAAGASEKQLEALGRFGSGVGLAFQIADDVLDVTGTSSTLGKPAGRDLDLHKSTYPALLGVAVATERASALVADACDALRAGGLHSTELDVLARYVIERQR